MDEKKVGIQLDIEWRKKERGEGWGVWGNRKGWEIMGVRDETMIE